MGTKYTTQSISGYNSSPPADDGTQVPANLVTWAKHKTKLGDPLKTLAEAINTALVAHFNEGPSAKTADYTVVAGDYNTVIQASIASDLTVTLPDAGTVGAGFKFTLRATGTGRVSVAPTTSADGINGNLKYVMQPFESTTFYVGNGAASWLSMNNATGAVIDVGHHGGAVGDGTTDDASAIQDAIDTLEANGGGTLIFRSGMTYKCGSVLTWDANLVRLQGNGAILNFSTIAAGSCLTLVQSETDANLQGFYNTAHPVENLIFVGPGTGTAGVTAVEIVDGDDFAQGTVFDSCSFVNFIEDVKFGDGAFHTMFSNCYFGVTAGGGAGVCVNLPSGLNNAGERITFEGCTFVNKATALTQGQAASTVYFTDCSFDALKRHVTLTAGSTYFNGCHIESSDDTDWWFHVSTGGNAFMSFQGCQFLSGAGKSTKEIFYSDSAVTHGGISVDNCSFILTSSYDLALCGGTGRTMFSPLGLAAASDRPPISSYQNDIAYGGFEDANYSDEWTLSGSDPAVRGTTDPRTGTYALEFPGAVGNTPAATLLIDCKPSQFFVGELYYKVVDITGTSGTFLIQVDYVDAGGNSLAGSEIAAITTNVAAYTRALISMPNPAPAGTRQVKVFIDIFGVVSGTPDAYVDDVIATVI